MRPRVAHLADQRVALLPGAQRAAPAAVAHAVGGDLVDREHEVLAARRLRGRPRARAARRSCRTSARSSASNASSCTGARGSGSGSANGRRDLTRARNRRRSRAARRRARGSPGGCGAPRRSRRRRARRCRTGRAARAARVGEREVEQRLVALALDELGLAAPGPDRLADAPDARGPARVRASRNCRQAGMMRAGLRADLAHVGELDVLGVARRARDAQQPDLGARRRRPGSARRPRAPSRMNGSVPARNSSSPAYSSASCRKLARSARCAPALKRAPLAGGCALTAQGCASAAPAASPIRSAPWSGLRLRAWAYPRSGRSRSATERRGTRRRVGLA